MNLIQSLRKKLIAIINKRPLHAALLGSVMVALILMFIAISVYYSSGYAALDLSRPGYEKERSEIVDVEPTRPYDTAGKIDKIVIDEFLEEYDRRVQETESFGDFGDDSLNDKHLFVN